MALNLMDDEERYIYMEAIRDAESEFSTLLFDEGEVEGYGPNLRSYTMDVEPLQTPASFTPECSGCGNPAQFCYCLPEKDEW